MDSKSFLLSILLFSLLTVIVNPQEKFIGTEQWINIDEDLIYNIVITTDGNQNITKGLLYGMKGDSIYLSLNKKISSIALKDLLSLSIENTKANNLGAVSGAFSGMYLGSLLFLTSKNQSEKYLVYEEGSLLIALYELLFVTVGGGIGYFIDLGSRDRQEVFYFNKDEEDINQEIKKLSDFLTNQNSVKKFHLSIHLSQVSTRYSEIQNKYTNNYYGYSYPNWEDVHNLNLLRKLSLTYGLFENFEFGAAISWFGEPDFSLYKYESHYDPTNNSYSSTSTNFIQTYNGLGYYLIMNYKPLKSIISDKFDIIIGGGIGFGKVDFNFRSETIRYGNQSGAVNEVKESIINKVILSSLFTGEMKYYFYPEFNISLQADYIYIPEKMPAIPALGYLERSLGNFSFGLGLGYNF